MDRQKEFVLRTLEERDIRFVRLWFTDVLGYLKSVAIAPAELEGAFEEGIGFDGSSIEGFARVSESDTVARPDPSTFQVLPWTSSAGQHHSARMFCDITMPDGSPSWADSRHVLRRQLAKASDLGFSCYVHPEIEFFLLQPALERIKGESDAFPLQQFDRIGVDFTERMSGYEHAASGGRFHQRMNSEPQTPQ